LSRASRRAYANAVADVGHELALKQNDPSAILEAARRKMAEAIDRKAADNPATAKTVRFAKRGNFKRF